jgi:hypothetical protein
VTLVAGPDEGIGRDIDVDARGGHGFSSVPGAYTNVSSNESGSVVGGVANATMGTTRAVRTKNKMCRSRVHM